MNRLENQLYEAMKSPQAIPLSQSSVLLAASKGIATWNSQSTPSESQGSSNELSASIPASSAPDPLDQVTRIKTELEEARRRLARSRSEETEASKRRLLEDNVTEDCQVSR